MGPAAVLALFAAACSASDPSSVDDGGALGSDDAGAENASIADGTGDGSTVRADGGAVARDAAPTVADAQTDSTDAGAGEDGSSGEPDDAATAAAANSQPASSLDAAPSEQEPCGVCGSGSVCCKAPMDCAGQCVPDCRVQGCLGGLTCNADHGVCFDPNPPMPPVVDAGASAPPSSDDAGLPPPQDAGASEDAGTTPPPPQDAGTTPPPPQDAGTTPPPPQDAGTTPPPPQDAGTTSPPPQDAGTTPPPPQDAGTTPQPPQDAGTTPPPQDAGTTPPTQDGGAPPHDGGIGPTDAGSPPTQDAGVGAATDAGSDAGSCTGSAPPAGSGIAEDNFGSTAWSDVAGGNNTSISGDTAVVGYTGVFGSVSGSASIYRYDSCKSSWSQEQVVTGSDTTNEDFYGSALAINGDSLVVGASYKGLTNSGGVYMYTRSGSTWSSAPSLTAPNGAGARFGYSVSHAGTTIAIGSPLGKDPTSTITYTGVVTIWTKGVGGHWSYQAMPIPAEVAHFDDYGYSVATDGTTMVAGAPGALNWGNSSSTAGKAWIFSGSGATWTQAAYLTAPDGATNDWFGRSVAQSGSTVIIGAPGNDGAAADAGAAYVYTKGGSTWSLSAKLTPSDASENGLFGFTVAAVSSTRVLVGARGTGKVYSFSYSAGAWHEDAGAYTSCSGTVGYSLAVSGKFAISAKPGGTVFDLLDPNTACVP